MYSKVSAKGQRPAARKCCRAQAAMAPPPQVDVAMEIVCVARNGVIECDDESGMRLQGARLQRLQELLRPITEAPAPNVAAEPAKPAVQKSADKPQASASMPGNMEPGSAGDAAVKDANKRGLPSSSSSPGNVLPEKDMQRSASSNPGNVSPIDEQAPRTVSNSKPGNVAPEKEAPRSSSRPGNLAPGNEVAQLAENEDSSPGNVAPEKEMPKPKPASNPNPGNVAPGNVTPGNMAPGKEPAPRAASMPGNDPSPPSSSSSRPNKESQQPAWDAPMPPRSMPAPGNIDPNISLPVPRPSGNVPQRSQQEYSSPPGNVVNEPSAAAPKPSLAANNNNNNNNNGGANNSNAKLIPGNSTDDAAPTAKPAAAKPRKGGAMPGNVDPSESLDFDDYQMTVEDTQPAGKRGAPQRMQRSITNDRGLVPGNVPPEVGDIMNMLEEVNQRHISGLAYRRIPGNIPPDASIPGMFEVEFSPADMKPGQKAKTLTMQLQPGNIPPDVQEVMDYLDGANKDAKASVASAAPDVSGKPAKQTIV